MKKSAGRKPAYRTDQENFWAGEFGNEYIERNREGASNLAFFARLLRHTQNVSSVVELGANIGLNLAAIRTLCPRICCTGVEINQRACAELVARGGVKVVNTSLLDWRPVQHDLAFTKGVLIHLDPAVLPVAYDKLFRGSSRYVVIAEYYNPSPVEVKYRGHSARLFKRDFAGEFLDRYPRVRLLDYGFSYHRDPNYPQDDISWFLMEKP